MSASRREFLSTAAMVAGAAMTVRGRGAQSSQTDAAAGSTAPSAANGLPLADPNGTTRHGDMLYRTLGKTGQRVSLIGLGGAHIGTQKDPRESVRIIRSAIDRGVTFMDNCWDYNNGESETRMGNALRDGYRDKVFLMTKIDGRTRDAASKQIEQSLQRLGTDHADLVQIHEVIRMEDPFRVFRDGCVEALQAAQKAGKLRYIGFTGHKDPVIHNRMLDIAKENGFRFDTVQMPINVLDAHFDSFAHQVLPRLVADDIGVLGMKPFASGALMEAKPVPALDCLHYAMSLRTSVVITGCDSMKILDQALEAVKTFTPLNRGQIAAILAKTAAVAQGGKYELFKTGNTFDSTAKHPQWLSSAKV